MSPSRRAVVVVDLGFGDAGKGLCTDALARHIGAHTVVRFNGGAQAGHNVVTEDGRHHTFSQLGAATFLPHVRTVLTRDFVVHPGALGREAAELARLGVPHVQARLAIAREAAVITPFHQATGRLREIARGAARHGSCGIGFGETVADARDGASEVVRVGHLFDVPGCRKKLAAIRERKRADVARLFGDAVVGEDARHELRILEEDEVAERFLAQAHAALAGVTVESEEVLARDLCARPGAVVFEGAQGVLIDEDFGFHPHTTWSHCTFAGALGFLSRGGFDGSVTRLGVTRTFMVRHGAGPFPTLDPALHDLPEPHNVNHPFQGAFRRGALDLVLLRYAIAACGGVDGVVTTHVDAGQSHRLRVCDAHAFSGSEAIVERLTLPSPTLVGDARLSWQQALGTQIASAQPRLRDLSRPSSSETWRALVEDALEARFAGWSNGPTAAHVRFDAAVVPG